MTKRKKPDQVKTAFVTLAEESVLHSGSEVPEPAAPEFPIQVLQTDLYTIWIGSLADLATRARITRNVNKMRRG